MIEDFSLFLSIFVRSLKAAITHFICPVMMFVSCGSMMLVRKVSKK